MLTTILIFGVAIFGTGLYLHVRAKQRAERNARWGDDTHEPSTAWTEPTLGITIPPLDHRAMVVDDADTYPVRRAQAWGSPSMIMGPTPSAAGIFDDDDDDGDDDISIAPTPSFQSQPDPQTDEFIPGGASQGFGGGGASGDWSDSTPDSTPEPSYSAPDPTPDYSSDTGSSGD